MGYQQQPRVIPALFPVETSKPVTKPAERVLPMAQEEPDESHLWRALAIATPLFILFYVALGIAAHVMRARGLI